MSNARTIRCLVTAGPTREFLDPVRFLSNPSTGKMGFAIARAAVAAGWTVDLVAGPVALEEPEGVVLYPVVSADEMLHQVDALFDACDLLIMAAAVSDFRPVLRHARKQKKESAALNVEFERTPDILKTMTARKGGRTVVGFAAETDNLEAYARGKMVEKRCDWMVANRVGAPGAGFASDRNEVLVLAADGPSTRLGPDTKDALAAQLVRLFAPAPSPRSTP